MRNPIWRLLAVVWCCAPLAAGCHLLQPAPAGKSPLTPLTLSNDAADLEIVLLRFPIGDPDLNGSLWSQVDEQCFSGELRHEMAANGIRAGVVEGQLPDALSRRLAAADQANSPAVAAGRSQGEPPVNRSRLQLHRGRPGKVYTSNIYDQMSPLMLDDDGDLRGKTYPQAQSLLMLLVDPQGDGRVRLALTPNLEYGQPRQQFVGEDGMFRLESGKPKEVFERLKTEVVLAPNQVLLMTAMPKRSGSLGHYMFTESSSGRLDQKLLMIRLAQTKFDDLFADAVAPPEPKPGKPNSDANMAGLFAPSSAK